MDNINRIRSAERGITSW